MKELERGILAAVDRVAGGGGAASSSSFAAGGGKMKRDPAHLARVGMSKLRRELRELEGRDCRRRMTWSATANRGHTWPATTTVCQGSGVGTPAGVDGDQQERSEAD